MEPRHQLHRFGRRRRDPRAFQLLDHEADKHIAQHLILAQHLVQRRPLRVAERTQFTGFLEDRGIRCDRFSLRLMEIAGNLEDEGGHVVEQTLCWKDVPCVHRQKVEQPLEPLPRKGAMLAAHPRGDEIAEIRDDHRDTPTVASTSTRFERWLRPEASVYGSGGLRPSSTACGQSAAPSRSVSLSHPRECRFFRTAVSRECR